MSNSHDIIDWIILGVLFVTPILAAIRLVAAAFSPTVRLSIRKYPTAHAIWLTAGILSILFFAAVWFIISDYAHRPHGK